ncbi:MAG: Hsp33 family molecular chaperone [Proteobacteria bacterium]|nr:Hsp33 family molecular chaperone [Pseudomonadota bacterium]
MAPQTEVPIGSSAAFGADDIVLPFHVQALDTRGRAIRLGKQLDAILARHAYPAAVERLLAEAIALTALMGTSLKFDGRFQLQTRSEGPVNMLVVDFSTPSDIRAYARFDAEKLAAAGDSALPGALLGTGYLGFTIEQTKLNSRYQGIVELAGQGLEAAALQYFKQSEQIPSALKLAVAEEHHAGGVRRWRAGGVLAQFLPAAPERMAQSDLDPGDAPEGAVRHEVAEDDAWVEARSLVETTEAIELVDPTLGLDRLLYRLFNERGVVVNEPVAIVDACRCSEEKIRETLKQFPAEELADMREPDGQIAVGCEFCARQYRLSL